MVLGKLGYPCGWEQRWPGSCSWGEQPSPAIYNQWNIDCMDLRTINYLQKLLRNWETNWALPSEALYMRISTRCWRVTSMSLYIPRPQQCCEWIILRSNFDKKIHGATLQIKEAVESSKDAILRQVSGIYSCRLDAWPTKRPQLNEGPHEALDDEDIKAVWSGKLHPAPLSSRFWHSSESVRISFCIAIRTSGLYPFNRHGETASSGVYLLMVIYFQASLYLRSHVVVHSDTWPILSKVWRAPSRERWLSPRSVDAYGPVRGRVYVDFSQL